jgi:hypothetical protein
MRSWSMALVLASVIIGQPLNGQELSRASAPLRLDSAATEVVQRVSPELLGASDTQSEYRAPSFLGDGSADYRYLGFFTGAAAGLVVFALATDHEAAQLLLIPVGAAGGALLGKLIRRQSSGTSPFAPTAPLVDSP